MKEEGDRLIFRTRIACFYYFAFIVVYINDIYVFHIKDIYQSQRSEVNNLKSFVYQECHINEHCPLMNSYMRTAYLPRVYPRANPCRIKKCCASQASLTYIILIELSAGYPVAVRPVHVSLAA